MTLRMTLSYKIPPYFLVNAVTRPDVRPAAAR